MLRREVAKEEVADEGVAEEKRDCLRGRLLRRR